MQSQVLRLAPGSRRWRALLVALTLAWLPCAVSAQDDRPDAPRVRIGWSEVVPQIDGRMDEAVWEQGGLIDQLIQVLPNTGAPGSQRTEVRLLTDGKTLFVGFRCYDTNFEEIVANRKTRDGFPFFDDRVGIALDTFHNRRTGFFFQTNPNAIRHDVLLEAENFEISWNTIWRVATSIDAEGWTAEMAIPYSSISFDPTSDTWGLNIERGIRRNDEDMRWADHNPARMINALGNAGVLEGMTGLDQGLGIEIAPALTLRRLDGAAVNDRTKVDPTVDAFYRVLPSVVASITANTDFGEVEVDDRQVNEDTRFDLFFPERRAFFLEDALIFDFGDVSQNGRPFFTRRFPGEIAVGGKVTGRLGPVKFGLIDTYTDDRPLDADTRADATNLLAARAALNVLGESTLGAIVTHGNSQGETDATTLGLDFLFRDTSFLDGSASASASFWYAKSINEGETSQNNGYGIKLEYPNDHINWLLGFEELQKNYDPKLGFVNRSDIRHWFANYRYRTRPVDGVLRRIDHRVFGQVFLDTDNELQTINAQLFPIEVANPLGDGIGLEYRYRHERVSFEFALFGDRLAIAPRKYDFHEGEVRFFTSRNRQLQAEVEVGYGTFYDARRTRLDLGLEWRPSHFWSFTLDYEFRHLRQLGDITNAHLGRVRAVFQLTSDISWASFVQYDNSSDFVGINSRIRWIYRDGRELFIVFNQGVDTEDQFDAETAARRPRNFTEVILKAVWTLSF